MSGRALIVVDVQNDFLPGGALTVPHGEEVVEVANRVAPLFDSVVATQDWHPPNHVSFAVNHPHRLPGNVIDVTGGRQKLWPVHCVQGSPGAALAARLNLGQSVHVIRKGTDPHIDSYSAFFDNAHQHETGLEKLLRDLGIRQLFVLGLATDYCVADSASEALRLGFDVSIIVDGCRGIDARDSAARLEELCGLGVRLVQSRDLPTLLARRPD